MSRYFAASIAATVLAMTCASAKDYSLTFHFTPPMYWCGDSLEKDAVYSSCDILNPNALDLGGFAPNQAWVIITGVAAETERGARSVRFGLEHGMSHSLIWANCTGGGDVEQDDLAGTWPASGTWIETYWDGCYAVTENEIGATRVGFLTVNPGSVGFMRIKGDPTRGGDLIVTTLRRRDHQRLRRSTRSWSRGRPGGFAGFQRLQRRVCRSRSRVDVERSQGELPMSSRAFIGLRASRGLSIAAALCMAFAGFPTTRASADEYSLTFRFTTTMYAGCSDGGAQDSNYTDCEVLRPNSLDLGRFGPNWAWVILTGVSADAEEGITRVRFGIDQQHSIPSSIFWVTCVAGDVRQDDSSGEWPDSGTWIEAYWDQCYAVTKNAIGATRVGFFTMFPENVGFMRITGDPTQDDRLTVTRCDDSTVNVCPERRGYADVDVPEGTEGINACRAECAVPVHVSSWSAIKASYR